MRTRIYVCEENHLSSVRRPAYGKKYDKCFFCPHNIVASFVWEL